MAEENVQKAKQILQGILDKDYEEPIMQKIIDHVKVLEPDSVKGIIIGIGSIGKLKYIEFGITDEDKIERIKKKTLDASVAMSGGARKRRTRATTVKQRKSSRRQLRIRRRRRTNKK